MAINKHLGLVGRAASLPTRIRPERTAWATSCPSYVAAQMLVITFACLIILPTSAAAGQSVGRFGFFETSFKATGRYANPYTDLKASAVIRRPDG
ncbi:MAG: hypothetical protein ACYTE3_28545, partial [Planctomycetota bacterium]